MYLKYWDVFKTIKNLANIVSSFLKQSKTYKYCYFVFNIIILYK